MELRALQIRSYHVPIYIETGYVYFFLNLRCVSIRFVIHCQVLHHRESRGAPWLNGDGVAVLERAHVQLARGHAATRPVSLAIDEHGAHATDAFAAIVVKRNRVAPFSDDFVVEDVHHLQERHVTRHP